MDFRFGVGLTNVQCDHLGDGISFLDGTIEKACLKSPLIDQMQYLESECLVSLC